MPRFGEGYVRNKLGSAVEALAIGSGSIQERVCQAWEAMFILYGPDMLESSERQTALDAIFNKLAEKADPVDGIRPYIMRWRRSTAARVAEQIVALYSALLDDRLNRLEREMRAAGLQPHMDW